MSFFQRLFGIRGDDDAREVPSMPWDRRPSILESVRSQIALDASERIVNWGLLPDEECGQDGIRFLPVAGAWDSVMIHDTTEKGIKVKVRNLIERLVDFSRKPTFSNKAAVYANIVNASVVSIIDPLLDALENERAIDLDRLYELALSFTTESSDREPVKFGIALLGLFRLRSDVELFLTLGRHEEFTLFCAAAISNGPDDIVEDALWELSRNVHGWGRIHAVGRLSETERPDIKDWLLREGFRNSVSDSCLAGTCARVGGLLNALTEARVDRDLLTSSGEIINALILGGPAEGIDDYEDGSMIIEAFLNHMEVSARTISDFVHVYSIQTFLTESDSEWQPRMMIGWTAERRATLTFLCHSILSRPEWFHRVRAALTSQDETTFVSADQAATILGMDTWCAHWNRLHESPLDPSRWQRVMDLCDKERIDDVLEFAESQIVLDRTRTVTNSERQVQASFNPDLWLQRVFQGLHRFPGFGATLIAEGLKRAEVTSRKLAAAALASWSRTLWPKGLYESLKVAAIIETDKDVRKSMRKILDGDLHLLRTGRDPQYVRPLPMREG